PPRVVARCPAGRRVPSRGVARRRGRATRTGDTDGRHGRATRTGDTDGRHGRATRTGDTGDTDGPRRVVRARAWSSAAREVRRRAESSPVCFPEPSRQARAGMWLIARSASAVIVSEGFTPG